MAIRYHYDLYPRDDPRDGALIRRFTKLQKATYRDVIGVGSGVGVIRSTDAEADDLDPRGEQLIRVVEEDTVAATETVRGAFWINNYKHETAVRKQTKRLTFAGAGVMAYLARSRMAPHTYIHDVFTGQDPFDGIWRLHAQSTVYANGNYLGAMLWRVIYEAQHWRNGTPSHRHKDGLEYTDTHPDTDRLHGGVGATAIPDLVLGFDQFEDSDGNAWTAKAGEFTAAIGENVLTVVHRLMQAGLYVEMDPVTFELRAWQNDDHRRDRTGGAWGTNVVRFQTPTDGTVATGNMLSESERELNSGLKRSLVWAGSGDTYAAATGPSDIPWEGFENSNATETDALEQLADTQITAREEAADAGNVRMKLGNAPASGRYKPWQHVKLDDLVTLDTGAGVWDYTEDSYPVAGLRIELQKSGAWWAWAELGASQPALAERKFQVAPVGAHSHPPNPELCRIGVTGTPPIVEDTVAFGDSGSGYLTTWALGSFTDPYLIVGITYKVTGFTGSETIDSVTWQPDTTVAGTYQPLTFLGRKVGASMMMELWGLHDPNPAVGANGRLHVFSGNSSDRTSFVAAVLSGWIGGHPNVSAGSAGTGTASSDSVACDIGDRILNWGGIALDSPLTAAQGLTELDEFQLSSATNDNSTALGTEVAATDPSTGGWTHASLEWVSMSAVFPAGSISGDLPADVGAPGDAYTGTSVRASRCDHVHEHPVLASGDLHPEYLNAADHDALAHSGFTPLSQRWEAVTNGEDVFVWEGDDLVHEWKVY